MSQVDGINQNTRTNSKLSINQNSGGMGLGESQKLNPHWFEQKLEERLASLRGNGSQTDKENAKETTPLPRDIMQLSKIVGMQRAIEHFS